MRNRIFILLAGALTLAAQVPSGAAQVADAAQIRDTETVRQLLAKHVVPNVTQPDGTTALHWAAHWNDVDSVKLLLQAGGDAKAVNRFGSTPLAEAAGVGNTAIVNALLAAGADARTLTTKDGETVLMTAARGGYLDVVKALAEHGADVNAQEHYKSQTALMWAAADGHADVVKFLLDHGADWKVQSSMRESKIPKLSAASSVTPMSRGGLTALHFSAREGDVKSAGYMLDAGADINIGDGDGTSPLTVAILNKHYTFAKFLLDRGANPNVADVRGEESLYAALDMRNEDYSALPLRKGDDPVSSTEMLQALLKHGADPNAALTKNLPGKSGMDAGDTSLDKGTTPLMRAARAGDVPAMELLLAAGADPKKITAEGNDILLFAAGVGYRDKSTYGDEAAALAAVKLALKLGLDLNRTNNKGETALHGAAFRGADTIVSFLAEQGASPNAKNKQGMTILDYAMGKAVLFQLPVPHDSTVELVRKLGGIEGKAPSAPVTAVNKPEAVRDDH
jgi:ankyrin repeat protein